MNKKRILGLVTMLAIVLTLLLSACNPNDGADEVPNAEHLYFKDGQFKIVQFSDFHEWMGIEKTIVEVQDTLKPHLVAYIEKVLADEQPDLVVLTGDNIFSLSRAQDLLNKVSIKTYREFARLFEKHKQYWTLTFGNHDSESAKTKTDFLNTVKVFEYFVGGFEDNEYYKQFVGEDDRVGNFSIPVFDSQQKVAFNVFLLDSGSYNDVPAAGVSYKYITDEQCDWYKSEAQRLKADNDGKPVPSILFTHIPLFEHKEAYLGEGQRIGVWGGFSPSETRSRIFEDAMQMGDVMGIFTGHNHNNSISVIYQREQRKIMMGITPQAAASSYTDTESVLYSRVIMVNQSGGFYTYIHTSAQNEQLEEGMPHKYVFNNQMLAI